MHIITILRDYMGITQQELARRAKISQADLSEIEGHEPYGTIAKYQRLSAVLDVPVHALVANDGRQIPLSFFEKHPRAPYLEKPKSIGVGQEGEEEVFRRECERLETIFPALARLVIPYFKLRRTSPGYDILSYDNDGVPIYIEVKTTKYDETAEFRLTPHEYDVAQKLTCKGEKYFIYRFTDWGTCKRKLHIIPFQTMLDGGRIMPCQYVCTMKDRVIDLCGLAYHRRVRGITQIDMAKQLGISPQHLCRYETGSRACPVTLYLKIAQLLEVSIDELLETYPAAMLR